MDKNFCDRIDREFLVEDYVAGRLSPELLEQFEQHISECEKHSKAVSLEKAMRKGVKEYAHEEMRTRLRKKIQRRDEMRVMILRAAAILFIVILAPILIYYQFRSMPETSAPDQISKQEKQVQQAEEAEMPHIQKTEKKASRSATKKLPKIAATTDELDKQISAGKATPEMRAKSISDSLQSDIILDSIEPPLLISATINRNDSANQFAVNLLVQQQCRSLQTCLAGYGSPFSFDYRITTGGRIESMQFGSASTPSKKIQNCIESQLDSIRMEEIKLTWNVHVTVKPLK